MIDNLLLIPPIVSFVIALFVIPSWVKKARQIGLVWDDVNKIKSDKVAGSGGLIVVLSFFVGMSLFIAYRIFVLNNDAYLIQILTVLVVTVVLAVIGLVDDLFGWHRGGLSMQSRIFFCFLAAIPLMAINAGRSIIDLPIIGMLDLGIFYPLFLIPLGIIATSTTFNFLAGFNGLEAGNGIIVISGLAVVAFITGHSWLSLIALCMVMSLLAFMIFNFYPAKVFPGDVLTYPVGGMIAIIAILGSFEKIAFFFFIPIIIEVVLKLRGGLQKSSFGKPNRDGTLSLKHDKIYGLTHLSIVILNKMKIKSTEMNVVFLIWSFTLLMVILGLLIFFI